MVASRPKSGPHRLKRGIRGRRQGIGVYFQVPGNYQVLEEILTAKSKKSKKEDKKGPKKQKGQVQFPLAQIFKIINKTKA
jgi:hypothetical protein